MCIIRLGIPARAQIAETATRVGKDDEHILRFATTVVMRPGAAADTAEIRPQRHVVEPREGPRQCVRHLVGVAPAK